MMQISKYFKMKYLDEILFSYRWHSTNSIKNTDRMKILADNTAKWEREFWSKTDITKFDKEIIDAVNNGVCYKRLGIPFLFEILSYKKFGKKYKVIKILNFVKNI